VSTDTSTRHTRINDIKKKNYKNSPGKHESLTSSILANNGPNLQIQAGWKNMLHTW